MTYTSLISDILFILFNLNREFYRLNLRLDIQPSRDNAPAFFWNAEFRSVPAIILSTHSHNCG